jgi:hypothetical protein
MVVDTLSYETTPNVLTHLATPNTPGPKKLRFSRNLECGDDEDGCSGSTIFCSHPPDSFAPWKSKYLRLAPACCKKSTHCCGPANGCCENSLQCCAGGGSDRAFLCCASGYCCPAGCCQEGSVSCDDSGQCIPPEAQTLEGE